MTLVRPRQPAESRVHGRDRLSRLVFALLAVLLCGCSLVGGTPSQALAAPPSEFLLAVSVVPGAWIVSQEQDLDRLSRICNTLVLSAGRYRSFQEQKLKPVLDGAHARGLKVILAYYALGGGDTTLEQLASTYGAHPAVIGFKVQDELGDQGESRAYWEGELRKRREAIRKFSDKPVMVDVVPGELWNDRIRRNLERYPAAANAAIDSYVSMGLVDWLLVSVDERFVAVSEVLPEAVRRWGRRATILLRASASFKGDRYVEDLGSSPDRVRQRVRDARAAGARGVHFYAWNHGEHRILNKDGTTNPLYEELVRILQEMER